MNKGVLCIAVLASVCCCILAECPTELSIGEKMDACMEKLLPGSSHDKVLEGQIKETIETLGKEENKELIKLEPEKINATMKQLAMRVLLCFADEFLKANPEITTVVFDCVVASKDETDGKQEADHEKQQMEIQECVKTNIIKMCPSKSGKTKRSLVDFIFN